MQIYLTYLVHGHITCLFKLFSAEMFTLEIIDYIFQQINNLIRKIKISINLTKKKSILYRCAKSNNINIYKIQKFF